MVTYYCENSPGLLQRRHLRQLHSGLKLRTFQYSKVCVLQPQIFMTLALQKGKFIKKIISNYNATNLLKIYKCM